MLKFCRLIPLIAVGMLLVSAFTQAAGTNGLCGDADLAKSIPACSKTLKRNDLSRAEKANAFFERGSAYFRTKKYGSGISDYIRAVDNGITDARILRMAIDLNNMSEGQLKRHRTDAARLYNKLLRAGLEKQQAQFKELAQNSISLLNAFTDTTKSKEPPKEESAPVWAPAPSPGQPGNEQPTESKLMDLIQGNMADAVLEAMSKSQPPAIAPNRKAEEIAVLSYEDRNTESIPERRHSLCFIALNASRRDWSQTESVYVAAAKSAGLSIDDCRVSLGLQPLDNGDGSIANGNERRVALVIGNNSYKEIPALDSPVNDASDMASTLSSLGFSVLKALDAKRGEMENALAEFAKQARSADVALVFYAGHGIQHEGVNYLIPTDGELSDETDLRRFITLRSVIDDLENSEGARILIIDACRDNEALTQFAGSLPRTRSLAFGKGLADESAEGVLIAYATQPGKVAVDEVGGRNSPFTAAILKHIKAPDTDIRVMFSRVRKDVLEATDFKQRPEVSDSMIGEFQFARRIGNAN